MAEPKLIIRVAATIDELSKNLEEGKSQIETTTAAMQKLATSFSGDKLIQSAHNVTAAVNAIGGTSKLTEVEMARVHVTLEKALEKYALLGKTAPAGMQALADATKHTKEQTLESIPLVEGFIAAFSAERIFEFVKGAIEAASRIEDLHLATGISAEGIQQLAYVGKEFGVDLEQMARGVEQLSAKLANGDQNATKAVRMLGLSVQDLIAAGPQEAFLQIAESVGRVENPMLHGGLATELFGGKLAKVLLPMLSDLRTKMEEVPKDAIISNENIKATHEYEVAIEHAETRLSSYVVTMFGWLAKLELWEEGQGRVTEKTKQHTTAVEANTHATEDHGKAQQAALTNDQLIANALSALRTDALMPLTEAQRDNILELEHYGVSQKEIAGLVGTSEIAVKLFTESHKAATEAEKKFAAAMTELNTAGQGWKGTLDTIDGSVAAAIKFYLQAGVSQNALAEAYGLTATQVKAVDASLKDELETQAKAKKVVEEWANVLKEVDSATNTFGTTIDTVDGAIVDWAEHLLQSGVSAKDVAAYYGLTDAQVRALEDDLRTSQSAWKAEAQAIDDTAGKIRTLAGEWIDAAEAKKRFDQGNTLDVAHAARDPEIMELLKAGWSLENAAAIQMGRHYNFQPKLYSPKGALETTPDRSERVAGYQRGGPTVEGPAYLHAQEYVVPQAGALVVREGAGAGVTNHIVINVTHPFGTPAEIGRRIDEALCAHLRSHAFQFPSHY